ncbi:hypothetical protein FBU30_010822 [Linnemannia zychae]|nr:hypothetical protein FBU30_010822 [Linnemannia zychae]
MATTAITNSQSTRAGQVRQQPRYTNNKELLTQHSTQRMLPQRTDSTIGMADQLLTLQKIDRKWSHRHVDLFGARQLPVASVYGLENYSDVVKQNEIDATNLI